jgi:hypothetical protein
MLNAALRIASLAVYGDLIDAIKANDPQRVAALLRMGEDPDVLPPNHSYVPLQIALLYSRLDCAIELLKHKANPNIRTTKWCAGTLLHLVVKTKEIAFIRLLLFFGANSNAKDQYNQEITNEYISTPDIRLMINFLCQQVADLQHAIQEGNSCLFKENYTDAILFFQKAAGIYEQQALEETNGTYDALYGKIKKPDTTGLIRYFNERALLGYQAAENAYAKLAKQTILTDIQEKEYYHILEKITDLCKKTNQPCEQYAQTMAALLLEHDPTTSLPHTIKIKSPSSLTVVQVASASNSPLYSSENTLRKRKNIPSLMDHADELTKPLLNSFE